MSTNTWSGVPCNGSGPDGSGSCPEAFTVVEAVERPGMSSDPGDFDCGDRCK